ncbi:hypothetical protein L3X38_032262 [Prunus dulcis]|uniref:Uncharacterized protein n=1 Tax=Prunus dulcis TaxID=3755 RepID=A0AAD4VDR2_PRUDU|nr:hypothetical protein L3X38_032262 [Prunus dulcis]
MCSINVLEVNEKWEGEADNSPQVPITYYHKDDIYKKLDLDPDKAKLCQVMNIPVGFVNDRKAASNPSKDEAVTSPARDVSLLRKKPRLPSSKFAEKTEVRATLSSSARVWGKQED